MKYYMKVLLFKCIIFCIWLISIHSHEFWSMLIKCLRSYAGDCTCWCWLPSQQVGRSHSWTHCPDRHIPARLHLRLEGSSCGWLVTGTIQQGKVIPHGGSRCIQQPIKLVHYWVKPSCSVCAIVKISGENLVNILCLLSTNPSLFIYRTTMMPNRVYYGVLISSVAVMRQSTGRWTGSRGGCDEISAFSSIC